MRSRKDQAQAYFFLVGRLVAGLLHGDPDTIDRPNRRPSVGTVIGLVLAILVAAGFAIFGLLRPGGTDAWRNQAGSLIMVKETGARYVLLDGQLRPVLNYASARLVLRNGAPVATVSRTSLAGVPVGAPIGIPGAPDGLPAADRLYAGPWTVCAHQTTGSTPPRTMLLLDDGPTPPLPETAGLLVATRDRTRYLVWQGRRFRLANAAVSAALGYGAVDPMTVSAAWLNTVPAGRDLAFPVVPGRGTPGPFVGSRRGVIGQVYELRNPVVNAVDRYLLRGDGFARLSGTAAALILADPATRLAHGDAAFEPIEIGVGELDAVGVADSTVFVAGYPPAPPLPVNDINDDLPCARHHVAPRAAPTVTLTAVPGDAVRSATDLPNQPGPVALADDVVILAGTGVLARNPVAPGAGAGAVYLINESGVKFPLADGDAVSALGYSGVAPVEVSSGLLALLPTGPVLSTTAALATPA